MITRRSILLAPIGLALAPVVAEAAYTVRADGPEEQARVRCEWRLDEAPVSYHREGVYECVCDRLSGEMFEVDEAGEVFHMNTSIRMDGWRFRDDTRELMAAHAVVKAVDRENGIIHYDTVGPGAHSVTLLRPDLALAYNPGDIISRKQAADLYKLGK